MDEREMEIERQHLGATKRLMDEEMQDIDRRFGQGIDAADERTTESIKEMLEARFRLLGKIVAEGTPYFGRIDFLIRQEEAVRQIYLGKFALHDGDGEAVVTDWRAPVANLYYESNVGPAQYIVENRRIEGDLMLKRKLDIKAFELVGYDDTDIISADAALLPYLSATSDVRLKSIIATIQAEQNAIIRQDMGRHLIVQGIAGSGKTTVALHRIAYLVYLHRKDFHPEHFMILSSGGFFLRYISGILPDLGVENVPQSTFEEVCQDFTGEELPVHDPMDRLFLRDAARRAFEAAARYKSSVTALGDIDTYIDKAYTRHQLGQLRDDSRGGKPRATAVYRDFLRQLPAGHPCAGYAPQGRWEYEDLTLILYIHHRLFAVANRYTRHIVIDEAQDFSPAQLKALGRVFQAATFTILGDIAQGIYPWRESGDWGKTNLAAFGGAARQMYLQKGYRTTVEIVEASNRVLDMFPTLPKGTAVLRRGDPVAHTAVADEAARAQACAAFLAAGQQAGHRNMAIIAKNPGACAALAEGVSRLAGRQIPPLTRRDDVYDGGACVITAALSKGLEFDAAIIADGEAYGKNDGDAHLLYVAMTRPMHRLEILHRGPISPLLV